jgi:formylglycine-generating enzyme required for sulfatase activity
MKNFFKITMILVAFGLLMTGCKKPVETVTVMPTSLTLKVGETATLSATVTPENADYTLSWTSSAPTIATVDNNGKVTANAEGMATITANAGDKTATCAITVSNTGGSTTGVFGKYTETVEGVSFEMIGVIAGSFTMGITDNDTLASPEEQPTHKVTLTKSYYVASTVVTQGLWKAVMGTADSSYFTNTNDELPLEMVNWDKMQRFLTKLNQLTGKTYRLLTEAEWEFAARGGKQSKGYKYSGSNNIAEVAWYNANSEDKTHPVATKKANELGIYDMGGNVWEWCSDLYGPYSPNDQTDPTGSGSGNRVVRGGSWGSGKEACRVSYRSHYNPSTGYWHTGFRIARTK